jgi:putative membrane protein
MRGGAGGPSVALSSRRRAKEGAMRHPRLGWVLALTLVGGGGAALGRGRTVGDAPDRSAPPDRSFVDKAAVGGMGEVELSRLAMERGQSTEVKQFARKMVEDHTKANTELGQIADKKGLTAPTQLDDEHQRALDKLSTLSGPEFDKEYMKVMAADHDATVLLFKSESKDGRDPELKSFAMKKLPVLERHDQLAHKDEHKLEDK